jgi:hypothetical protein
MPLPGSSASAQPAVAWQDIRTWGVEGRAWPDKPRERWFDRLPSSIKPAVAEGLWNLGRDSSGMLARFTADSPSLFLHYRLVREQLALPHMPATGASGIDLYARDTDGRWRWAQAVLPTTIEIQLKWIDHLPAGRREYALYLPLYNGIESLAIGVPDGAALVGQPPRTAKPIVFYGTSITQGACASRPGLAHTSILGRRLDRPIVNLGFSGHGRLDLPLARLLGETEAAVYVIDCLPNLQPAEVAARAVPFVRALREHQPDVPVILVEDRSMAHSWIQPPQARLHEHNRAALQAAYQTLRADGAGPLYCVSGDNLLGEDGEGTTDGSHPNDLGFRRQADALEPVLRQALARSSPPADLPLSRQE